MLTSLLKPLKPILQLSRRCFCSQIGDASPSYRYAVIQWGRVSQNSTVFWRPRRLSVEGEDTFNTEPSVTAGNFHAGLILKNDKGNGGRLFAFGKGEGGRLGIGEQDVDEPTLVKSIETPVLAASFGGLHSAAICQTSVEVEVSKTDDNAEKKGSASSSEEPKKRPTSSPTLFLWGYNGFGQLGFSDVSKLTSPRPQPFFSVAPSEVSCGGSHTLICLDNGDLVAFGRGDNGRLGVGNSITYPFPVRVDVAAAAQRHSTSSKIVSIACGGFHNLAINESGQVLSWGGGRNGELGRQTELSGDDPFPNFIPSTLHFRIGKVKQVSAGGFHSALLTENGEAFLFGLGQYGQLVKRRWLLSMLCFDIYTLSDVSANITTKGAGSTSKLEEPECINVEEEVTSIALGGAHTLFATASGRVLAFGANRRGELGIGDADDQTTPQEVDLSEVTDGEVISVSAGSSSSFAVVRESV